jgi:hypothetical protein
VARLGASSTDTVARIGTCTADAVAWFSAGSANTLVK